MTPWTAACQAPPSVGVCRQEYWSGLPFPSPGDLHILESLPALPEVVVCGSVLKIILLFVLAVLVFATAGGLSLVVVSGAIHGPAAGRSLCMSL